MLTVNIRDLARSPKKVLEEIKKSKQPKLIVSQKKPQAVIVSLEEYEELTQAKAKQAALGMLKLAVDHREELKGLPADLRQRATEILYTK